MVGNGVAEGVATGWMSRATLVSLAMTRWGATPLPILALVTAAVGCDGSPPARDEDGGCNTVAACRVDLDAGAIGAQATVDGVCWSNPPPRAAGLYDVCLVAPDGTLYLTVMSGSTLLTGEGWTHSGYGNSIHPSTLSPKDGERCNQAMALGVATVDAAGGFCWP